MNDFDRNLALEEVTFFLIEKAMKATKRYSSKVFSENGFDVTIDQFLVLKKIWDKPQVHQHEVAKLLYKDTASITRILDVLSKKGLVIRQVSESDRRRFELLLTQEGKKMMDAVIDLAVEIRVKALAGIPLKNLEIMRASLKKMADNLSETVEYPQSYLS